MVSNENNKKKTFLNYVHMQNINSIKLWSERAQENGVLPKPGVQDCTCELGENKWVKIKQIYFHHEL